MVTTFQLKVTSTCIRFDSTPTFFVTLLKIMTLNVISMVSFKITLIHTPY